MDKSALYKTFNKAYSNKTWLEILQTVFGVRQLLAQPKPIILANNDKANAAFELGSFTTTDDRIIGLYQIEVKPEVWLERNKVGLRQLLRNVYKYDVDGAIIVFVQENKWRLSFVSEIKVLNDEGEIMDQITEPKRYTYLLGEEEKVRTPADRLSKLAGKPLSLQDILNAFSVEALNEEFYKIIQAFFYELVGGKVGKGKKVTDFGKGILQLPSVPKENRQEYQEFAVRLIGRTVFCWFLKMKKSPMGEALLPEGLLSSKAVKIQSDYYHTVLERLFFQTLNTPMEQRVTNLPEGSELIPFLNGGLFEPGIQDYYKPDTHSGLNKNIGALKIDNQWFVKFFEELEKYNFTIDENSVTDVEVSVDPEMLGRIFENLLAEIDPDSGETARKATGSFYTPREIVDYMATESLVQYIHNKTNLSQNKLRPIFKMMDRQEHIFTPSETECILDALDTLKILDPACGSGAFPMGVMQKIVQALQKLDPDAVWWKKRQVDRITNAIVKKQLKEKLEDSSYEYARKIGVIQNSLYGVDIQPIAAEISKLRCFLTLIVDEIINDELPNRGIEPLPNLEFKFVTADTLIKLPEERDFGGLFNANDDLDQLELIRQEYLQSYGEQKSELKIQFKSIQGKIAKQQISNRVTNVNSRAFLISTWNPFGHEKSNWFDPKWMFGVEKFDVVIGNPPFVRIQNLDKTLKGIYSKLYTTATKNYDIYVLFDERGMELLNDSGSLIYIQPNKFFNADYGIGLRTLLSKNKWLYKITDFQASQIFSTATTYTCILHCVKNTQTDFQYISFSGPNKTQSFMRYSSSHSLHGAELSSYNFANHGIDGWAFGSIKEQEIYQVMEQQGVPLLDIAKNIFVGLQTSADPVYILQKSKTGFYSKYLEKEVQLEQDFLKPLLKGSEIRHYKVDFQYLYLIFPYELINGKTQLISQDIFMKKYPLTWSYLLECEDKLRRRENDKMNHNDWYAYVYPKNLDQFEQPKIMTQVLANKTSMVYDENGGYHFVGGGNAGGYGIVLENDSRISYWYLLCLLNSRLLDFYLQNHTSRFQNGYFSYAKRFIGKLPIIIVDSRIQEVFSCITRYVQFLTDKLGDNKINEFVSNSHIAQLFEEVIDAMVMQLYFKEDFNKADIAFIKYVERDFKSIENKPEQEQIEIIHQAYQKLREKDNEIRNNLKLMDIKLADIVMPIKSAK